MKGRAGANRAVSDMRILMLTEQCYGIRSVMRDRILKSLDGEKSAKEREAIYV